MDYHFPKISFGSEFVFSDFMLDVGACIVLLAVFVFASINMSVELGTAPYDALPVIISNSQKRFSFRTIRILWDAAFTILGFLLGGTVGAVTVFMVFTIGPMVAWMGKRIRRFLE